MNTVYGDRHPGIVEKFPECAFYHVSGNGVIDVTKAPFFAKGDGVTDDTRALCDAMTFVRTHLPPSTWQDQTYCSQIKSRHWIVYLPAGTYRVSGTVSQNWPALGFNLSRGGWSHCEYFDINSPEHERELYMKHHGKVPVLHGFDTFPAADDNNGCFIRGQYPEHELYDEANWAIIIIGESRENTVIKLDDNAPGFGEGEARPVLTNVLLERGSNVNIGNFVENLTIDTGCGNPSASAMRWNCSNYGGIRNVTLKSSDGQGAAGLLMDRNNVTGYFRDITISGFDTAMLLAAGRETMVTFEYGTICANRIAADIGDAKCGGGGDNLTWRKMDISAPRPVICRQAAQVITLESILRGSKEYPAVEVQDEAFFLGRKLEFDACGIAVKTPQDVVGGEYIEEFYSTLPPAENTICRVDIADIPLPDYPVDPADWAVVEDFGAVGNGIDDDTEAIRRAFAAGKKAVFFASHIYAVSGEIHVPGYVNEISGVFSAIIRCSGGKPDGIFVVSGDSPSPLRIRRLFSAGGTVADHVSARDLVLEDIYVAFNHGRRSFLRDNSIIPRSADPESGLWACSRNASPDIRKREFVTDCIMPLCSLPDGTGTLENLEYHGRMLDSEHVDSGLYAFRNCDVNILGFKSENSQTLLSAEDNSRLEVLGGSMLEFSPKQGPLVKIDNSELSAIFLLWHISIVPDIIISKNGKNTLSGSDISPLPSEDAAVVIV